MRKIPSILFVVQLPPPFHGVSVMNEHVVNNPLLEGRYEKRLLHMDFGQTLSDLGTLNLKKAWFFLVFLAKLKWNLLFKRPDLVYFTFMPRGLNLYRDTGLCLLIKLFGYRPLIHLHGRGIKETAAESRVKRWLYRMAFRGTQLICLSESLKADVVTVYKETPLVLANGIDAPVYDRSRRTVNTVPVILFFSNLFIAKGIYDFLEMLRQLHIDGVPFRAIIAGGEGDVSIQAVTTVCEKEGFADHVEILGSITGSTKWDVFHRSDIFVLPSHNECFPLTILEAMSAGLPVIATRIGGIPDMILQEQDGFIVEIKDTNSLYECVKKLCTDDRTLLEMMAQNAYKKYTSLYTIRHFRENFLKMLDAYYIYRK